MFREQLKYMPIKVSSLSDNGSIRYETTRCLHNVKISRLSLESSASRVTAAIRDARKVKSHRHCANNAAIVAKPHAVWSTAAQLVTFR